MEITDKTEVTDKTEITERTEITEETNRMDVTERTEITERTGGEIYRGGGRLLSGDWTNLSYCSNWVNWGFKSECVVFFCLSFVCCACILAFLDLWRPC